MEASLPTLIVVAGPTASGKTDFAIELAEKFKTEIISADSRQLYKEISIGTAKPSPEKLKRIKHHFIDHCSIFDEYNTGLFETEALGVITELFKTRNIVIMAGGTGLYIKAVCNGLDELPKANPQFRLELQTELNEFGVDHLYNKLQIIDSEASRSVDPKNPARIMRALEIINATGKKLSEVKTASTAKRSFKIIKIMMDVDRETLYKRINDRTLQMMEEGFLEEAIKMHQYKQLNALNTVGYKELFQHIEGTISYEEAIDKIQQHTRNYAKRQLTWFRNEADFIPHNVFNPASLL